MLHSPNQPFMDHIDQKIMFILLFYFMGTLLGDLSYQYVRSNFPGDTVLYVLYVTKYLIGVVSYFVLGLTLLKKGNNAKS